LNGGEESANSSVASGDTDGKTAGKGSDEDDEVESSSSSSSSEETKDARNTDKHAPTAGKKTKTQ